MALVVPLEYEAVIMPLLSVDMLCIWPVAVPSCDEPERLESPAY